MTRTASAAALLGVLVSVLAAAPARSAEADVAGSRDPYDLERFPRSWIVAYEAQPEARPRDFVMSRVDRIRRDMRVQERQRVDAGLEWVTYRIPDGVDVDEVLRHYRALLGSDLLFQCRGRDCGRSNDWANQIFGQAILYGPDQAQRYAALEWQGKLVALYVIQRGNKRVYAHLRFLEPQDESGLEPNVLLTRRLAERGWAVIDSVAPGTDGSLGEGAAVLLAGLADSLTPFADQPLFVVCHLGGRGAVDVLLEASRRCAETGLAHLVEGMNDQGEGTAPRLEAFGAGPLLPRPGLPAARLELVSPAAVTRGD